MTSAFEMKRRFGATVRVTPPEVKDRQLFLVLGNRAANLKGLITGLEGKPVLAGPAWVLAEIGYRQAMALRAAQGVRIVTGVSIDPKRFGLFRQCLERKSDAP